MPFASNNNFLNSQEKQLSNIPNISLINRFRIEIVWLFFKAIISAWLSEKVKHTSNKHKVSYMQTIFQKTNHLIPKTGLQGQVELCEKKALNTCVNRCS